MITDRPWSVTEIDGRLHVIPVNDLQYHTSEDCDCRPQVRREGWGVVLVHRLS